MKHALSRLLEKKRFPSLGDGEGKDEIDALQLKLLNIQQRVWHGRERAIVVFEGFDAAGKGGAIRTLDEKLDPRGIRVHPIGPPEPEERGTHYLARFWSRLPKPGTIAIFDRSWYGRVLVERVEKLTPKKRWMQAYDEINGFERLLQDDGIRLVKIFLAIHKDEQARRFKARREDPAKRWKLTPDDVKARRRWPQYVEAADEMIRRTSPKSAPWHLIPADSKEFARRAVLRTLIENLDD